MKQRLEVTKPVSSVNESVAKTAGRRKRLQHIAATATALAAIGGGVGYVHHEREADRARMAQLEAEKRHMQNQIDRLATAVGSQNNKIDPGVLSGKELVSPATLPATGQKVSPEQHAAIKAATVKIAQKERPATASSATVASCSAIKVVSGQQTYLLSAAHCFEGAGARKGGGFAPQAINVTKKLPFTYTVLNPDVPATERLDTPPIAMVTDIAVDQSGSADIALARVAPNPASTKSFDAVPAVNLDRFTTRPTQPEPGQEVALYSMPGANKSLGATGTGTYLGRIYGANVDDTSAQLDLVGINPADPGEDACNFGGSGSSAIFANGMVSGPLATRNSNGYGPDKVFQPEDHPQSSNYHRLIIEQETKLNLGEFSVVCGFTVLQSFTDFDQLRHSLDNPAYVYYPPLK